MRGGFFSFSWGKWGGFGSLPWIQRTNQSPTHTFFFFLSRTGTNMCVFAERLTASNVLPGTKLEGTMKMAIYSCHSLLCLSMFFRMKSELFVVTYKLLLGPLSVYITSLTSFFSLSLPLTSKNLGSLWGLWQCHLSPPLT